MQHKWTIITLGITATAMSACEIPSALSALSSLYTLGAIPAEGFSDVNSQDFGLAQLNVGGADVMGAPLVPLVGLLEIQSDQSSINIESSDVVEGHDSGELLLLVDGSGSLENFGCDACPTDPDRHRVEAVKLLTKTLHECAEDWQVGLSAFGTNIASPGYQYTETLVGYSKETLDLVEAADDLDSDGGTPLWDSVYENLHGLNEEVEKHDAEQGWQIRGRGLIVVSDGEDTESLTAVSEVVALANRLDLPVSVVALGASSDVHEAYSSYAIEDLRTLAKETGGFYASVSDAAELPKLAEDVAGAYCGGYTELRIRFDDPPESGELVNGQVKFAGSPILAPFVFRAP